MNKEYKRNCPKCGKEVFHTSKDSLYHSKNRKCKECHHKDRIGTHCSEESKNKIGQSMKRWFSISSNKQLWIERNNTPEVFKKRSDSHKGKIPPNKGIPMTDEQKLKCSQAQIGTNIGKKHSEETKRKHRINVLSKLRDKNIGVFEDKGAKEWFEKYNKETNSNFQPKRFMEIGYDADGYDENKHIWIEYDPPHHNRLGKQKKDLIRQNNIIKYFEDNENPLAEFIRYSTWDNKLKKVYGDKSFI